MPSGKDTLTWLVQPLFVAGVWFCNAQAVLADDDTEGEKLYQKGKMDAAAAYFERAIDTNGYDAKAHYFLGHCMMAQKNYVRAQTEYEKAMEFTDDSKMEAYCKTILEKLKAFTNPKPVAKTPDKKENRMSDAVAAEKTARVRAIMERCEKEAKELMLRAEERCKPIQEEKKNTMQTMSITLRRRVETTTSEERDETRNEYDRQIESIRHLAKQQANGIMDQGRRDAAAVGQGLPNLDELLQSK